MWQMLGRDRRGACKEQLISLKALGTSMQREWRVCSTAVNPSLEGYFPCGIIFPVPIFRKEFVCLLSPTNASECALRKPEHMLTGFLYQVLQASFKHVSYPLGLMGPLMPRVPDDLTVASAVSFKWKKKVSVTTSKKFTENWNITEPLLPPSRALFRASCSQDQIHNEAQRSMGLTNHRLCFLLSQRHCLQIFRASSAVLHHARSYYQDRSAILV